MGDEILEGAVSVNEHIRNLSASFPDVTPQRSVSFSILTEGILTTKSLVCLISLWDNLDGLIEIPSIGGLEQTTPHQASVMIFVFPEFLSRQLTNTTGTG